MYILGFGTPQVNLWFHGFSSIGMKADLVISLGYVLNILDA